MRHWDRRPSMQILEQTTQKTLRSIRLLNIYFFLLVALVWYNKRDLEHKHIYFKFLNAWVEHFQMQSSNWALGSLRIGYLDFFHAHFHFHASSLIQNSNCLACMLVSLQNFASSRFFPQYLVVQQPGERLGGCWRETQRQNVIMENLGNWIEEQTVKPGGDIHK